MCAQGRGHRGQEPHQPGGVASHHQEATTDGDMCSWWYGWEWCERGSGHPAYFGVMAVPSPAPSAPLLCSPCCQHGLRTPAGGVWPSVGTKRAGTAACAHSGQSITPCSRRVVGTPSHSSTSSGFQDFLKLQSDFCTAPFIVLS